MRALDSKRALDCVCISRKWPHLVLGKTDCCCLLKLMPLTPVAHLEVYLRTSVSAEGNTIKFFFIRRMLIYLIFACHCFQFYFCLMKEKVEASMAEVNPCTHTVLQKSIQVVNNFFVFLKQLPINILCIYFHAMVVLLNFLYYCKSAY